MAEQMLAWLRMWGVVYVVADNSGVGVGLVNWQEARLGQERITGYTFNRATKASLDAAFLSVIEAGRLKHFASEYEGEDTAKFFIEAAARHDD